jgi:cobalt-zinc-cadmium efflux system membrane fusion protein
MQSRKRKPQPRSTRVTAETHTEDDGHGHGKEASQSETAVIVDFSKALQEQLPFATSVAAKREMFRSIRCLGEIKPAGSAEAEVFAPFEGVLKPCADFGMVQPGQRVKAGQVLADLAPSSSDETGWQRLLKDYRLAKAEFERVQRLAAADAVTDKRQEEARLELSLQESRIRGALGGYKGEISESTFSSDHFHLVASSDGVLTDVHLRYGQHVQAGEHLFGIIDPSRVWLEAMVPMSLSESIEQVRDAYFVITGSDSVLRVSDFNGRLIAASSLLDPETRRIPVIFELNNDGYLRTGSFAQVFLQTGDAQIELAIPEAAIVEEDGIPIAFKQFNETEFEKRVVSTGIRDNGYVSILSGLDEGDRVVTTGAYKLRLASLKTSGGSDAHAGHGH